MTHILLADDDTELCELLTEYLRSEGFEVSAVHNGEAAVSAIAKGNYDMMVLDVMMPKMSGFDALRELRKTSQIPVLMLTARGQDIDRIVGLEMGADDYLPKPCNPRELVARIRAILRRLHSPDPAEASASGGLERLVIEDVEIQPATRRVICQGQQVDLTGTEFNVLAMLMKFAGRVVSKKQLTEEVLDRKLTQYDRSMDVHVSNIRKKLGLRTDGDDRIKTVRGLGYIYISSETKVEG